MSEFTTVPDSIRVTLRASQRSSQFSEQVDAMLAGKTIFMPKITARVGTVQAIRGVVAHRSRSKSRLVSRQAFVDGESGIVMWAVPVEEAG